MIEPVFHVEHFPVRFGLIIQVPELHNLMFHVEHALT